MKRMRSSEELESHGEREARQSRESRERGALLRDSDSTIRSPPPSQHHRSSHHHYGYSYKSSRYYDRTAAAAEDRDTTPRPFRKRSTDCTYLQQQQQQHHQGFDHHRRKGKGMGGGLDTYSNNTNSRYHHRGFSPGVGGERGPGGGESGCGGGSGRPIHRSESFSGAPRRSSSEFPKGFRPERDHRSWSVSSSSSSFSWSWRRYGGGSGNRGGDFESDDGGGGGGGITRGGGGAAKPTFSLRSPPRGASRDPKPTVHPIPAPSRDSTCSDPSNSKSTTHANDKAHDFQVVESAPADCEEIEEGELEPEQHQLGSIPPAPESESEPEPAAAAADPCSRPLPGQEVALVHTPATPATPAKRESTAVSTQVPISVSQDEKQLRPENASASEPDCLALLGAEPSQEIAPQGKLEAQQPEIAVRVDDDEGANETLDSPKKSVPGVECSKDELATDECGGGDGICDVQVKEDTTTDGCLLSAEVESKDCKAKDPQIETEDTPIPEPHMKVSGGNGMLKLTTATDEPTHNATDKGKGVVLLPLRIDGSTRDASSPLHINGSTGEASVVGSGLNNNFLKCRTSELEGPSTRGFELFPDPLVKKPGRKDASHVTRLKDEKITLEPLDLSLSLPNVLLPISSCALNPPPASPNLAVSVQSLNNTLCTDSGGFTASMSFPGSQQVIRNPSCSLTQNSHDNYEHSVGSRPIFQGVGVDQVCQSAWQGQSAYGPKQGEFPLSPRILMNGDGSLHQYHASQGIINGGIVQGQHLRVSETSSKTAPSLDRQLSFSRQLSGVQGRHYNAAGSSSQSVGSYKTGSENDKDKMKQMKEKNGGIMYRSSSQKGNEQVLRGGSDFVEAIISMIVCEPINVTNRRFQELTEQATACLRESVSEILVSPTKQGQRSAFQKALQTRSDINFDMLIKCPQVLLEVMVALKTGLNDFLQQHKTTASDLAEIFLDLRCKNLSCGSPLPADECDCKICVQKTGFCSSCMCLVCSKFDLAYNTCSWVGCDICLHWCHTDCALRKSLIRNGPNVTEGEGLSEMQFHCVACDQPSQMFGFVKEVFQNFAKIWSIETLSKELEYVRRIFCASKDMKGRQLHDIADQMLAKLISGSELSTVYNLILHFLSESGSSNFCTIVSGKEQGEGSSGVDEWGKEAVQHDSVYLQNTPQLERTGKEQGEGSNGVDGWGKEAMQCDLVYSQKAPHLESTASMPPLGDSGKIEKCNVNTDSQHRSLKEPVFDELASIVRIKKAEAKMFQARADDARREAEGLKRIATAKNEKIEEEFRSRITKLRLVEAEEVRKQKLEQLQAFERARQDYFNMKTRMEVDIKDLLLKMEATKQKLSL